MKTWRIIFFTIIAAATSFVAGVVAFLLVDDVKFRKLDKELMEARLLQGRKYTDITNCEPKEPEESKPTDNFAEFAAEIAAE